MMGAAVLEDLQPLPLPACFAHLVEWYLDLASARSSNGFGGINPISYSELLAWATLKRITLRVREVDLLRRIDGVYLRIFGEVAKARSEARRG